MNEDFHLTESEARRQSPLYWRPPAGRPFDVIVGDAESSEFLRQSRARGRLSKAGVRTRYDAPAANHYRDRPWGDPASAMVERLAVLAGKTR
jgi:hypothetical protein